MEVTAENRMLSPSLSLWLGAIGTALAVVFSSASLSFSGLSGGVLRRLETKRPGLAEQLEAWLLFREDFRVQARLLLAGSVLLAGWGFAAWDLNCGRADTPVLIRFSPLIAACLCYLLVPEWLGRELSTVSNARFLRVTVPLVRALGILVFPLSYPLILWHRWRERSGRVSEEDEKATAEDEIRSLVEGKTDEGVEEPDIEDDERRMIRGVFDLDDTLVREIMTPRVDVNAIPETTGIAETRRRIVETGHSRIPVYRGSIDEVTGIVFAKDLLDDERVDESTPLSDLVHQPVFIPEAKNIGDLLAEFQQANNQFAVVLDEYGGTAGVVTVEDILEEIVGEIRDEYDREERGPGVRALGDGRLLVDARTPIYEINEVLELDIPEDEDYDTFGGYISTTVGRIPRKGEVIETEDLIMEILEADPRRVLAASVRKKEEDAENAAE
jgi:CBS domain containing-hemolysin-like protein